MTVTAPPRPPRGPSDPVDREEVEALVETLIEEARQRARRRRRKYGAVAAFAALVGVALLWVFERTVAAESPVTLTSVAAGGVVTPEGQGHVYVGVFQSEGKRGSFQVQLLFPAAGTRSWKVARGTGQYAQITGGGRMPRVGGRAQAWSARLEGFLAVRGAAKQRVAITIKGRPNGVFVLTPLQFGALRRDSGTQSTSWLG